MVSTVKQDETGDGYLRDETGSSASSGPANGSAPALDAVEQGSGTFGIFDRIKRRETTYAFLQFVIRPHLYFLDHPPATLVIPVPMAIGLMIAGLVTGSVPTSLDGFINNVIWSTVFWIYLPVYVICIPLTVFYEWNVRSRYAIIGHLSDDLRKLSSANDTGQTILESIDTVATTSQGKLADEFTAMRAKVEYGTSLGNALREFNNKYHIPRLARTVKLISKAQEASSEITDVLTTAAQASENQDDIERERRSRTLMQVVIILATYVTLLGVMAILKVQFLEVLADMSSEAGGSGTTSVQFGTGVDPSLLSLMFFHAVTLQAILSGMISGYIRDANIMSGLKYVVILISLALTVWIAVE